MSIITFSLQGKAYNATITEVKAVRLNIIVNVPPEQGGRCAFSNSVEDTWKGYPGFNQVVTHLIDREKNIEIRDLRINTQGDIKPLRLFNQSFNGRAGFCSIHVDIEIETNVMHEENEALIREVKEPCPVNDNLANDTLISYLVKQPIFLN